MLEIPKKSNQPRTAVPINSKLEKNLAAYMAAGAAGLALSAAAQPAVAKVIYTPANINATLDTATLDLNNDGIPDFTLGFQYYAGFHSSHLLLTPGAGNSVRCVMGNHCAGAAPGFFGVPVGPGEKFIHSGTYGGGIPLANYAAYGGQTYFTGNWANLTNRYLGLKIVVDGQTHYGWARLSVGNPGKGGQIVISGYAYETTPNTKIIEGHISGPSEKSNLDPAVLPELRPLPTLGMLARGSR